ncbi:hypothetical protein E4K67_15135 [Desulfosporosinus fructosivorans]|uniref:NurA domain-containing protein n=1 Tax=Desulfosporosinus fructosivorans TaxID=2018669 RepID=A0A4Z0R4D8_9FIRM|nr:hypothetical protein [Desulfosporosinus fructosivorans]TGE37205.1 hypothetical protein E4K67_15135 [Desulfosporosinus fructosivorans]
MRFDLNFRQDFRSKVQNIVEDMKTYNSETTADENEILQMANFLSFFKHCPFPDTPFTVGGSDSSGEFPLVSYGDSFVYLVTARMRLYTSTLEGCLKEIESKDSEIIELFLVPEDQKKANKKYDEFFSSLVGMSLLELCQKSDYLELRNQNTSKRVTAEELTHRIVKPPAHDASNVRINIMTAAEMCTILRVLNSEVKPTYVLADTTLTLPLIKQHGCLFFELVKRYVTQLAIEKRVAFFAISKSHGMPHMDQLEDMIKENGSEEHWYLRIPTLEQDGYRPEFLGTRGIPPVGAVTYIFRFHKTTPPMRLDMDIKYWEKNVWHSKKEVMAQREAQIFRDLDFASHEQRVYGYPYPIKASHDMVSLTDAERLSLKKQFIDAAEKNGLKRRNFVNASMLTGHS